MISNKAQTNNFTKGMNLDSDISFIENNQYRYAENIRIVTNQDGTSGGLQNIEGVLNTNKSIPENEEIIGTSIVNDIGVVFTNDDEGYTKIYRVIFNENELQTTCIFKGILNLCKEEQYKKLSIVTNYEDDDNIKIYFTDGYSEIKVINLMDDKYINGITNSTEIDIHPGALLKPFKFVSVGEGNLPSGNVQYCYQLFNLYGSQTVISPLSPMIHLTKSTTSQNLRYYEGTSSSENSNRSCTVSIDNQKSNFDSIRIIRILYKDNTEIPSIQIIDEITMNSSLDSFSYTDYGNSFVSELTLEEFNDMYGYQFTARSIAKLDNRLFASNITDNTWDVKDYDTRAYRFTNDGYLLLESSDNSSNISMKIEDISQLKDIPYNHDCINPYNKAKFDEVTDDNRFICSNIFSGGVGVSDRIIGGSGLNISYQFTETLIQLSDRQNNPDRMNDDPSMDVTPINQNYLNYRDIRTFSAQKVYKTLEFPESAKLNKRLPNYADPYIAANFVGYQRDEIYRFGIIFYNEKSIASPVHWIADIRMPHSTELPPFRMRDGILCGSILGIKFLVDNLPDDVHAYEIVRCKRTDTDRTIVTQCTGQLIYNYLLNEAGGFAGTGSTLDTSKEYRPFAFPTGNVDDIIFSARNTAIPDIHTQHSPNHIRLVSPEISLLQEDIEKYINNNAYLDYLYKYYSLIDTTNMTDYVADIYTVNAITKIMAGVGSVLQNDGKIGNSNRNGSVITKTTESNRYGICLQYADVNYNEIYYNGNIYKYNKIDTTRSSNLTTSTYTIEDYKYPKDIQYNQVTDLSSLKVNVGDIQYTNFAMSQFRDNDWQSAMGAAGPCLIVKSNGSTDVFFDNAKDQLPIGLNDGDQYGITPVFNIKQQVSNLYGGDTYTSRSNSTYISIGQYHTKDERYIRVYGGDIYLNVLDYPHMMTFQGNDVLDYIQYTRYIGMYIPFESRYNLSLLNGDMAYKTYNDLGSDYLDTHLQLDVTQKGNYHIQDRPYYLYNDAYSAQSTAKTFVPKGLYTKDKVNSQNRIIASQAKTANEINDNFTIFKVADYLDVDNSYGPITNLYVFDNKLFYWQKGAFGAAAVNERSLISDNNNGLLQLGTGGILSRYYYLSTTNGSNEYCDRSITNSDSVLYWIDTLRREICAYNGQVNQISKEKKVQSYMNTVDIENVEAFFDKKYNEIQFRLKLKDYPLYLSLEDTKAWLWESEENILLEKEKYLNATLVYNEQNGCFTSFYTFNPDWSIIFQDKVLLLKNNKYYIWNGSDNNSWLDYNKIARVIFVVNDNVQYTKVFDNVRFHGDIYKLEKIIPIQDVIKNILFKTKYQYAELKDPVYFDLREDTYRIPVPRQDGLNNEVVTNQDSYSLPARMRGKYLICEYTFDTNDSKKFVIPYITTTYRYSLI